jgi:hypothetical protein
MAEQIEAVVLDENNTNSKFANFDMCSGLQSMNRLFKKMVNQDGWVVDNLNDIAMHQNLSFTKPTREQILKYLKNPETNQKQLRKASIYLYEVSTQYRRLINYFAGLLTFDYIIVPYNINPAKVNKKSFELSYLKAVNFLQLLNIKHEMIKVLTVAYREDVFYGYRHQEKDSSYIRELNADYCKITSVVDGCFIYSFDFSYFDTYKSDLDNYGDEFISKYRIYEKDKQNMRWQQLDQTREFCIKITDSIFPCPILPFAGVLDYIFRILDYCDLQQAREELENYKIIGLKIPVSEEGEIQLDLDIARDFYKQLCNVLPDSVGAFITPMDFKDISFDRSNAADSGLTVSATRDFWNSAGVSAILFGEADNSSTVKVSIQADVAFALSAGKQIERNINRLLKYLSGTIKFQVNILPNTLYNQQDTNNLYLKNALAGIPCKTMVAASLGETPSDIVGLTYLENDFLSLTENWTPLQTSYTQSGTEDTAGRPTNEENGETLTEAGEETQKVESNANR